MITRGISPSLLLSQPLWITGPRGPLAVLTLRRPNLAASLDWPLLSQVVGACKIMTELSTNKWSLAESPLEILVDIRGDTLVNIR